MSEPVSAETPRPKWLDDAIEAGAHAYCAPEYFHLQDEMYRGMADRAITAALPLIEAGLRSEIAAEIQAITSVPMHVTWPDHIAARIVAGDGA